MLIGLHFCVLKRLNRHVQIHWRGTSVKCWISSGRTCWFYDIGVSLKMRDLALAPNGHENSRDNDEPQTSDFLFLDKLAHALLINHHLITI